MGNFRNNNGRARKEDKTILGQRNNCLTTLLDSVLSPSITQPLLQEI
uniref:Uncharacterized protein n=1 Tax=Zea mays TaxID=4577 RepID=C0PKB5_MAIZE|nr:unknown [Zea mays]